MTIGKRKRLGLYVCRFRVDGKDYPLLILAKDKRSADGTLKTRFSDIAELIKRDKDIVPLPFVTPLSFSSQPPYPWGKKA